MSWEMERSSPGYPIPMNVAVWAKCCAERPEVVPAAISEVPEVASVQEDSSRLDHSAGGTTRIYSLSASIRQVFRCNNRVVRPNGSMAGNEDPSLARG